MSIILADPHTVIDYPEEILYAICAQIYMSGLQPEESTLDPLLNGPGIPTAHPSAVPPSHWSEPDARKTLSNLCLVSHSWFEAAKPWLWRRVEVRLPRTWISLVEQVAWNYGEEPVDLVLDKTIRAGADAAKVSVPDMQRALEETSRIDGNAMQVDVPEDSISVDLLSPVPSRNPSPRRLRPKGTSPARWKIVRSISDAIQYAMENRHPGMYVPSPRNPLPGRFVRHLDFNHFRTIGMRRSVEEGVNSRFVTGERVEAVLKELPNLLTFGATEYMDGALTLPVLKELFLRGAPVGRGRPSRSRAFFDSCDIEEEDMDRRRECKDLEAVDFTGCISAVFVNAFQEFVSTHLLRDEAESSEAEESAGPRPAASRYAASEREPLEFPGMRRLGLRGVKSILPHFLGPFLMAFPSLTHLDLSGTRITPEILDALGNSPTLRLKSLALARCIKLSSDSICRFLVESPVTSELTELNLYGDMTYVSVLTRGDLMYIFTEAPAFTKGQLVYLDISSSPVTAEMLAKAKHFPNLRSLGLSHITQLGLPDVATFIADKAPNVEVLTLINTSPELDTSLSRQSSIAIHTKLIRPLCTPPFKFSLFGNAPPAPPPTRLRVIELSNSMINALGAGAGSWRLVRSKGGRGWYVDTASAWVADSGALSTLRRDLPLGHPYRLEMEKLSNANGNVSSGVGWHARKMEILHGHGMLGREDGLYGAVSFAYQG